jgi:hypothetical protein
MLLVTVTTTTLFNRFNNVPLFENEGGSTRAKFNLSLKKLRAPLGDAFKSLRMQGQTAARFEDILAYVTLTGAGSRDSRLLPIWDQTRVWDPGD